MKFSKEVRVAALAIVSGTVLYFGFNFLKGTDIFSSTNTYYVNYDHIDGLTVSNPVTVNGLSVGRVSAIELDQENNNRLNVTLEVAKSIRLGDSTVALLSNSGLLGTKMIKLEIGKNTTFYEDGATLRADKEMGLADVVAAKANPLIEHLDSAIIKVNGLLGAIPNDRMKGIVANLDSASGSLKLFMRHDLRKISGNVVEFTDSLIEVEKNLNQLLTKFSVLADSLNSMELKATVAKANQAMGNLTEITRKINAGEGTMGALVTDKSLYENLNKTISDIDSLVKDLQYNPNHYLAPLGKKPKKKKK